MADADTPREFAFELALCAHLEETTEWILGRQLGAAVDRSGRRIVDVVGVVPGPDFDDRARITDRTIPIRAIESDVGVGTSVPRNRTVRNSSELHDSVVDAAVDAGFFATERHDGREFIRQTARYPDSWFAGLVGIENKPDLGAPGDLARQLRTDVSLGLFEEVVLATESHVTRAHLNRIPEEVGVWRFDPETGRREEIREATALATGGPGVELVDERPLRTDVALVDSDGKARARTRVAERAYGKGWRTYDLPACAHAESTADGRPRCAEFERIVDPSRACGAACPARDPGTRPDVDADELRDERTPWRRDPPGVVRRQAGLDRFG